MSTFPLSEQTSAQSLAGTEIQSTFADTGNGNGAAVGAYPRCVASGALAVAGAITTITVQLAVAYPGSATPIPILSSEPGSASPSVDHTYTSDGPWCLLTTNHAGGVVYVQVKGDIDGTSGDTFTAFVQGVTP